MFDNIIIIGATGLVGIEFVKLIKSQNKCNLILISSNHIGKICPISGYEFKAFDDIDYSKNNIYVNCANSDQAVEIESKMNKHSYLIDNSSQYRMNENIPLVIPEINFQDVKNYNSRIIANPNCSTIILAMLLNPFIKNNHKIKRIVVSTYQAASGAGKVGLDELLVQTSEFVMKKELQIIGNNNIFLIHLFIIHQLIQMDIVRKKIN